MKVNHVYLTCISSLVKSKEPEKKKKKNVMMLLSDMRVQTILKAN